MGGRPLGLKPVPPPIIGGMMPTTVYDQSLGLQMQLYSDQHNSLFSEQRVMAASLQECQLLLELYEKRRTVNHQNLAAVQAVRPLNDLCLYGVQIYRQYFPVSLRDQLAVRKLQDRRFEEKEVLQMVRDISEAVQVLQENDVVWGWIEPINVKRKSNGTWAVQDYGYPLPGPVGDLGPNLAYILDSVLAVDSSHYSDKLRQFHRQVGYYTPPQISSVLSHWTLRSTLPELPYVSPVVGYPRGKQKAIDAWE